MRFSYVPESAIPPEILEIIQEDQLLSELLAKQDLLIVRLEDDTWCSIWFTERGDISAAQAISPMRSGEYLERAFFS